MADCRGGQKAYPRAPSPSASGTSANYTEKHLQGFPSHRQYLSGQQPVELLLTVSTYCNGRRESIHRLLAPANQSISQKSAADQSRLRGRYVPTKQETHLKGPPTIGNTRKLLWRILAPGRDIAEYIQARIVIWRTRNSSSRRPSPWISLRTSIKYAPIWEDEIPLGGRGCILPGHFLATPTA